MDEINALIPVAIQAQILQYAIAAGLAMPFLEWLVGKIPGKTDDAVLVKLKSLLAVLSAVLPGPGGVKAKLQVSK